MDLKKLQTALQSGSQKSSYTKEEEAQARANGFKSAAEAVAWQRQREMRRQPSTVAEKGKASPDSKPKNKSGGTKGGVANILDRVTNALRGGK